MPARARTSGVVLVRSLPSKRTRPERGLSRPMTLLSSVVLPTPLRPMRHTSCPGPTSRSTPRRISVSPYATCNCSIRSMGLSVLAEIDLDDLGVALDFLHCTLAKYLPLVKHRDLAGDLPDEGHVVVDDDERVFAGHRLKEFAGALGFARRHAGDGLVNQEQLGVLGHEHAQLQPLFFAVRQQPGRLVGFGAQADGVNDLLAVDAADL